MLLILDLDDALHDGTDMVGGREAVTAEHLTRQAMPQPPDAGDRRAWLEDAADCFRRHGLVIVREAIPREVVSAVLEDFRVRHDVHMAPGQKKLYRRFQTDPLRAQVPVAVTGPAADPRFFAPPSMLALARKLMGPDVIVGEMGVVITHAGTGVQETHRDSSFLFGGLDAEIDLPPYAMTMLVPLVDVPIEAGPTEFWPGSHRIRDEAAAAAGPPLVSPLAAGTATLHDARLFHRGGANVSGPVRPAVYVSFHRSWYLETPGYEHKPQVRVTPAMLAKLPEEYRPLFAWALHLNRTDSVEELAHRWIGRVRHKLQARAGR